MVGDFFMEITPNHWSFICETACKTSSQIYVPIYPLTPEHSAKPTFEMLLSLYNTVLVNEFSDGFTVMGDSAGGTISLSFAMLLRDQHLTQPENIILISPLIRLTDTTPEEAKKIALIEKKDPILSYKCIPTLGKWWSGDLDCSHYFVSPGLGDLHDLGKITLLTGTHDVLSVTNETFYKRTIEENISIDFHLFEDMFHCWVFCPTKEGKAGRDIIFKTIME